MAVPIQVDQKVIGKGRLLEQFKNKPNLEATLRTYLKQTSDLETNWFGMLNGMTNVVSAVGEQLDNLGRLVGVERNELSDTNYKKAIDFKIGINNSQATPNYLTQLLKDVTESPDVYYSELYPAAYTLQFNGDIIPSNFLQGFIDASPSTINPLLIHNINDKGIIFSEEGDASPTADTGILPEDGDASGFYLAEGYAEGLPNVAIPDPLPDPKIFLRTVFSVIEFDGTGATSMSVDVGMDLTIDLVQIFTRSNSPVYSHYTDNSFSNDYLDLFDSSAARTLSLTRTPTGFSTTGMDGNDILRWNNPSGTNIFATMKRSIGFSDIVSYTGDGTGVREIQHILGITPAFVMIERNGGGETIFRLRDLPINSYFVDNLVFKTGSMWGGSFPTDQVVTIGDIGGVFGVNTFGTEYVMTIIADNPDGAAVTTGSYIGDGVAGHIVDIGNKLGWFLLASDSAEDTQVFNYLSKLTDQYDNDDTFQTVDQNGSEVVLTGHFSGNQAGVYYYWVNIADPR